MTTNFLTPAQYADKAAASGFDIDKFNEDIAIASSTIADTTASVGYVSPSGKTAMQILIEQQGELEAQNRKQQVAAAANFDELSVVLGKDLAVLAMQQRELAARVAADSQVSLFDDPLQALSNAFTIPWDRQALEGVQSQIASTSAAMNAVNSHVQNSAQTAEAIKTKVTQASIADGAEKMEMLAKIQAAQARITASKEGIAGVKTALEMDHQQLAAYMNQRQLDAQEENQRMARERAAKDKKLFDVQWAKYEDELQAEKEQLALINVARDSDGLTPLDINGLKRYKATAGKLLDTWLERGLILIGGGKPTHGESLPEMMSYRATTGWVPKTAAQQTIVEMQGAALTQAASQSKDKGVITTESGKLFNVALDNYAANIKTNDQTNPFIAPAYSVYEQAAIGQSDLWKRYVAPTISDTNRNLPVDPQRLVEVFSKAALNKEIRPEQAAEFIADVYKVAVATNNAHNDFYKIAGREQKDYKTRIQYGPHTAVATLPREIINMADPVQVKQALVKKIVAEMGFGVQSLGNSLGWPGYSIEDQRNQ